MYVLMNKPFEYRDAATGRKRRVPAGWAGELPDGVVGEAVSKGYGTCDELAARAKKAADLAAAREAVTKAEAGMKAAKSEADKVKAEAAWLAANEALAKLEG